jgi:uncharacterized membrane protein HdeD (DUF308 family)
MTDYSTDRDADTASFWLLFVLGVATMCFGIAILAWPDASVRVVAVMVGIWLLLAGIARIVGAFVWRRGLGRQLLSGIVGILLVIGGVACLRDLAKGAAVLAFLIALVWILSGIAELVIAQETGTWARRWLIVVGAASLVVGFVFVFTPELTLAVMALLAGLSALVIGAAQVLFAFRWRRLLTSPPPPQEPDPPSWRAWDANTSETEGLAHWRTNPETDGPRGFTES